MKQRPTNRACVSLALACLITGATCLSACGNCDAEIIYPKAPEGGRLLVSENAKEILQTDPQFLGGFRVKELALAAPYQNFAVGLNDLASGHLLSAAKFGGNWTYLFLHGTNAVGAAGLIANPKTGKAMSANGLFQTNLSNETLNALREARKLTQVETRDYELRRLDISPIHFVAVWLHGKSDDIIIPLPPTFGRWEAYRPYSESQMIRLLKPEAKKRLKSPRFGG